jgi:phosphoglycerol transferase MdoB-like AlkP superfamily enzyme
VLIKLKIKDNTGLNLCYFSPMMKFLSVPRVIRWILMTVLFILLIMTLLRFIQYMNYPPGNGQGIAVWPAFLMGLRFDLRAASVTGLLLLLLTMVPGLHPFRGNHISRFGAWLTGIMLVLLLLIYTIDFAHYAYLSQRLNASALSYLQDAGISVGMVWQSYPVLKVTVGIILVSALLIWVYRLLYKRVLQEPVALRPRIGWTIACLLLLAAGAWGKIGQFPLRWSDAFSMGSDYEAHLALNPFQSFFSSLQFRNDKSDEKKVKTAYPLMAQYLGLPTGDSAVLRFERNLLPRSGALGSRPNIVLVICESFSAYKSSMWDNPLNTTPFFNQMAKEGIFFENCFTPAYGTARGVWALITGVPDVQANKTASRNPAMVDQHTIINDFKEYEKLYFLGGSTSWANIRGLLTNNIEGLRLYEDGSYQSPRLDVWGISDNNLFKEANQVLRQQNKPFFAIIQTADNHRPYSIPAEDLKEFKLTEVPEDSLKRYGFESNAEMNAFRYTDYCFQKYMEAARKETYFNNTVFVFIGDHGIRGNAGNMFPEVWTKQGLTCVHVPLLLYAPGMLQPARETQTCSQLDVLPTLAGLTGHTYRNSSLGRDLLDTVNTRKDNGMRQQAFIIDHDEKQIGMINNDFYYTLQLGSNRETFTALKPDTDTRSPQAEKIKATLKELTMGYYETARYLLFNNKKKTGN